MRRPRIRIWMLMMVVAIIGTILGAVAVCLHRRTEFARLADYHSSQIGPSHVSLAWPPPPGGYKINFPSHVQNDWRIALALKYHYASEHPWLPVWPDPPEPK